MQETNNNNNAPKGKTVLPFFYMTVSMGALPPKRLAGGRLRQTKAFVGMSTIQAEVADDMFMPHFKRFAGNKFNGCDHAFEPASGNFCLARGPRTQ